MRLKFETMNRYALLIEGNDERVDYTSFYNRDFIIFDAGSKEEARIKARDYYDRYGKIIDKIFLVSMNGQEEVVSDNPNDPNLTRDLEKELSDMRESLEKEKKRLDDILSVIKDMVGIDPKEIAGENGDISLVACNLLVDAVRIKAAQMRAKEK